MTFIFVIVYVLLVVTYSALFLPNHWRFNAVPIHLILITAMFIGETNHLDLGDSSDRNLLFVDFSYLGCFIIGAIFARATQPTLTATAIRWKNLPLIRCQNSQSTLSALLIAFGVSFAVTCLYFYMVGYNLFLESIYTFITSGSFLDDFEVQRADAYRGDQYYAPGYVNQFKNTLLPLTAVMLYLYFPRNRRFLWLTVSAPIVTVALLGTGQRHPFVLVAIFISVIVVGLTPGRRLIATSGKLSVIIALVFILASFLSGRQESGSGGDAGFAGAIQKISERIFADQQLGAVVGFRYIDSLPTAWGSHWIDDLAGILPGNPGSLLDNEIFLKLYGR